jgi:hypothetical protein
MSGRHRSATRASYRGRHRAPRALHERWAAPVAVGVLAVAAGSVGAYAALTGSGSQGGTPPARHAMPVASVTATPGAAAASAPASGGPAGAASTRVTATPVPSRTPQHAAPAGSPHRAPALLEVRVVGHASWVDVRRGSRVLVSRMVHHRGDLVFRRGPLQVVIGDAGAVDLRLAGHVRSPAGAPGEVLRFSLPAGPRR